MLTAAYLGDRTVGLLDLEPVPAGPGQARIRVGYVGLCGTDLHVAHGDMDARVPVPLVFGHEMSGTVESVGEGVDGWAVGDQVVVMPLVWDGVCAACVAGHRHVCENLTFLGIDTPGALQPLWTVPADTLVRLPQTMDLRHAALVEPVAVAVHDVRRGAVTAGDRVVVLGGGPIGTLIAVVAADVGAHVTVVEPDAGRRALVEQLGFRTLDPGAGDLAAEVRGWTDGAGADVVFEVSGAAAAVAAATGLAKVRGTLVVVAIHAAPREVDLHRVFLRELTLLGARVYDRTDVEEAVRLVENGTIPVEALITRVVALPETSLALEDLGAGRAMKVLVDVQAGQPEVAR